MSHAEERMIPLLTFPFGSFLMLRLEYVLLTDGNELEAQILRLIEKRMEDERRRRYQDRMNAPAPAMHEAAAVLDISKEVWIPISHALFLYDLYGLVQSENTLKRALKNLLARRLIFRRKGQGRYAPDEYQLNVPLIEQEFARMRQQGRTGYQPLLPSQDEPQQTPSESQVLPPSEDQPLLPSPTARLSTADPLRVSATDPTKRETEKNSLRRKAAVDSPAASADAIAGQDADTKQSVALSAQAEPRPLSGTSLDAEAVVRLVEDKRGIPYDATSRSRQLASAQRLLELHLPLDIGLLERVYDECYDPWWQQHFGDLHVTHLVEREKQHGEPRIVRLLKRVLAKTSNTTSVSMPPSPMNGQQSPPVVQKHVGVSGLPLIQASAQPLAVISQHPHPRATEGRVL